MRHGPQPRLASPAAACDSAVRSYSTGSAEPVGRYFRYATQIARWSCDIRWPVGVTSSHPRADSALAGSAAAASERRRTPPQPRAAARELLAPASGAAAQIREPSRAILLLEEAVETA